MPSAPSPTIEGFRVMFGRPIFAFAEITWRWCVGLAGSLLALLTVAICLNTLPVSRLDLLLLRSRQPGLIARSLANIFRGSSARLLLALVILALALTLLWIVAASFGRMATIKALIGVFRSPSSQTARESHPWRLKPLIALHFFRAAAFVAAFAAGFAPFAVLRASQATLDGGNALLIAAVIGLLIALAWSMVNWFLSLAAVFVVCRGDDTFGAMGGAIDLCRERPGPVFAVGTWFGLAHAGAFTVATFLGMFAMGLFGALPASVGVIALLVVTLCYFAVADFFYMGRLAAYVAILELPEAQLMVAPERPIVPPDGHGIVRPSAAVDRDELIVSDLPRVI
jgi:hypothetical protein